MPPAVILQSPFPRLDALLSRPWPAFSLIPAVLLCRSMTENDKCSNGGIAECCTKQPRLYFDQAGCCAPCAMEFGIYYEIVKHCRAKARRASAEPFPRLDALLFTAMACIFPHSRSIALPFNDRIATISDEWRRPESNGDIARTSNC